MGELFEYWLIATLIVLFIIGILFALLRWLLGLSEIADTQRAILEELKEANVNLRSLRKD